MPKRGAGRPSKYLTRAGDKVPSVTTILSRFKESGALVHWAWKLGWERKDYRKVRDDAAGVGSAVHNAAESYLHGVSQETCEDAIIEALPDIDVAVRALQGFHSFLRWHDKEKPEITETELPLVSERHRFAGCIDDIAKPRWQIDLKTGKRVYADHLLQIAAYDILHEECRGERFERFTLLHIPQDGSECMAYDWTDLSRAREMFLALLRAYELDSMVKETLREVVPDDR
jgi:hypothetical protein